jgi:hypothetical protein|tara:strand:+ start:138 stop:497 length:360 start_codon:yes stop_codon:yes gene_type:complete
MDKLLKIIDNDTAQPWTIKIIAKNDAYGRDDCLTHDDDELMVEFYDGRYIENFDPEGQFVSRYNLSTIANETDRGINLHGGVDSWSVNASAMKSVRTWLRDQAFTYYAIEQFEDTHAYN